MAPEPKDITKAVKRVARGQDVRTNTVTSDLGVADYDPEDGTRPFKSSSLRYILGSFTLRSDGYLRVIPDGAQKSVYWKWKYTRGEFAGHYVMVVTRWHEPLKALQILKEKLDQVELGLKKPSWDSPNSD